MKSILLASASVFAFAGASAADVNFGGDAALGYNDEVEDGFYWSSNLDINFSQELDNGLTAGADITLEFAEDSLCDFFGSGLDNTPANSLGRCQSGFVLYLEGEMAALRFGDLDPVAEDNWGGIDGSAYEDFNDQDAHFDVVGFDSMLVGEISYGNIDGMISFGVDIQQDVVPLAPGVDELDALQIYLTGDFGNVSTELAYQQDLGLGITSEVFALGASTTFGGADVGVAFVKADGGTNDGQSIGVDVAYPVGPVTLGGYFTSNDNDPNTYGVSADYSEGPVAVNVFYDNDVDGNAEDYGIEGSYDVGNGLMIMAGVVDRGDAYYLAGDYDLGGGAGLLVSFADDDNAPGNDEIGDPEYNDGTTVEVSFEF